MGDISAWMILATQLATLVGALVGVYVSSRNRHAIQEVHLKINSLLDKLIAANKIVDMAEGRAAEAAEQAARSDAEALRQRHEPR